MRAARAARPADAIAPGPDPRIGPGRAECADRAERAEAAEAAEQRSTAPRMRVPPARTAHRA
jgi:hypothetical protein